MSNKNKTPLYIFLILIVLLALIGGIGSFIIKNKIKKAINTDLPDHIELTYDNLKIGLIKNSLKISNANLKLKNKGNHKEHSSISVKELQIENLNYWNLLFQKEIKIREINIIEPEVIYHKDRVEQTEQDQQSIQLERNIYLNNINLSKGRFTVIDKEKDSIFLYSKNVTMKIENLQISNSTLSQKIPFNYSDLLVEGDSIFVKAGIYENVAMKKFRIDDKNSVFNDVHFYTKYSIQELNQIIPHERDHYELQIESVKIKEYDYDFSNDSLFVASKKLQIVNPDFLVYRDKTIKKDTTFKPLYNRSLRKLPFALSVDSLIVENADIKYTERHQKENFGGEITFKNLNADIGNIGNTYSKPIQAHIDAYFMDTTAFSAIWELDVQNPQDNFLFRAEVHRLDASNMNRFVTPNLNAKLEGEAIQTFFTIDGNNESSKTDVKIKYQDFKVSLLTKDEKKKKILSSLVNVVIPKDSKEKGTEFNDGTGTVDRHKTQSVFNQLWISLESSLKDAMLPEVVKKISE